jgi:putative endopeptidase
MSRFAKFAAMSILLLMLPLVLPAQSSVLGSAADAVPTATIDALTGDGCSGFVPEAAASGGSLALADPKKAIHGYDPADFDRSVAPCDDFYKFTSGGWMKNNPIPSDRSTWTTFGKLRANNESVLHDILEEAAKDKSAAPGSNRQKIGDFYASCMDESQAEAVGTRPLDPEFRRIAAVKDIPSLQEEIAHLQRIGVDLAFGFGSVQDFKDSTQVVFVAAQGGLGMPDRQYYLDEDDRSKTLRAGYIQHVTNMFKLLGDDAATSAAEAKVVVDMETSFAMAATKR